VSIALSFVLAAAVNWPVGYNAGVTAYQSNEFAAAASAFKQATAAPERALQQRAHYNLGNTTYRLGEADPKQAKPLWERAIKSYETALALEPKDEDAKFNRDFVKKKLEELEKQQQQQQDQKNQDQQKQKQDQQQKSDQSQQQQDQKQDEQKSKPDQPKPDQQKSEPKDQNDQPQPQQAQASNRDKQQAAALLDNLREDERNWNFFPEVQMKDLKDAGEPEKDW